MSWYALDVTAGAGARDRIAAWLVERTGQAIEERGDGSLVAFAGDEAAADDLIRSLVAEFGEGVTAEYRELPEIDWSLQWREGLGPRTIGRLVVTPSWTAEAEADFEIVIDPESAFGTGEHGSTRGALLLIDRHLAVRDRVLDLGSGSGILSIAAAKLGASRATGIEIDADVEAIARGNAERNGVSDRVEFLTGDAAALAPLLAPADLIVSNILRTVNVTLLGAIRAALAPGGRAIFAGMEAPERDLFLPELTGAGFTPFDETVDENWWAVAARSG